MDDRSLFDELLRVATRLGVDVRIEPFETPPAGGGGRCVLAGKDLILLDARASLRDRVAALASALANLNLDDVYVTPEARDRVEAERDAQVAPARARAARPALHDGRRGAGALLRRGAGRGDGPGGARLGGAARAAGTRARRRLEPGRRGYGSRRARPADRPPGRGGARGRSGDRAHGRRGRAVGRRGAPGRRARVGGARVPERHSRARRRHAHPERRRLRAGRQRDRRGGAGPRPRGAARS